MPVAGADLNVLWLVAGAVFGVIWLLVMPYQIMKAKALLREILAEQRRTNEILWSVQAEARENVPQLRAVRE